jgi:hypothetical protein
MKNAIYLLPLMLAACGEPASNESATTNNSADYAAEVAGLPDAQLRAVLFRAVRDAGIECQGVDAAERVGAERVGAEDSRPQWRARCTDGTQHLVTVDRGGTALVVSRAGN